MSWKSLVTAGLLCIVASPAMAATANAVLLGLDVNGNWVWQVNVDPNEGTFINHPTLGNGGSVAIEFAATASGRGIVSAAANTTNFPSANPGTAPAGWGNNIDGANPNPDEGVAYSAGTDRVVAFLGSAFFSTANGFATPGAPKEAFRIHTERPISAGTTTTLTFTGAWDADGELGGTMGFIGEQGVGDGIDLGVVSKGVLPGNLNLDQFVNVADLGTLATFYNPAYVPGPGNPARRWQDGDFNGDGIVNIADLGGLATSYGGATPVDTAWTVAGQVNIPATPGAGAGGLAIAVPEPASLVLVAMGAVACFARRRRS